MVEGERRQRIEGPPRCLRRVVTPVGPTRSSADLEDHRNGVFARIAARVGVDADQAPDTARESGLFAELPQDRLFYGFPNLDEAAR